MPPPPCLRKTNYRVAPGGVDFGGKPGGRRQGRHTAPAACRAEGSAGKSGSREGRGAFFRNAPRAD